MPKVKIVGNKKDGYVITIEGKDGFKDDIAITHEEAQMLLALLEKKV